MSTNREVSETIVDAKNYFKNLENLDGEIEQAIEQISCSCKEAIKNIETTFSHLLTDIVNRLNNRKKYLLGKAESIKNESIVPLNQCRRIIKEKMQDTEKLIELGSNLQSDNLLEFCNKASLLGSLPEVPELKHVPYLSFTCSQYSKSTIEELCDSLGEVIHIAPIQITEIQERPGSLLVSWQALETNENLTDIQEFRLQKGFGNVLKEKHLENNFSDCYRGTECQFLVKDLNPDQPYSFRVCCKFEGNTDYSEWSFPQVASTKISSLFWKTRKNFSFMNENKIVQPLERGTEAVYSDGPQIFAGCSIEFTILELDDEQAILGLAVNNENKNFTREKKNSFLTNSKGSIFIDGLEKSTKLPVFSKGTKVCFTCENVNNDRLRVNVDSGDRRVTYDWAVDPKTLIYFTCQLPTTKWKIMVE